MLASDEIKDEDLQEKIPLKLEKTDVCTSKCIQQLQLVLISQDVVHEHFDSLGDEEKDILLSRLKQSYFRVYEFNSGIDKRYEMWKSGRLPLTSHADSIPRLTKQE